MPVVFRLLLDTLTPSVNALQARILWIFLLAKFPAGVFRESDRLRFWYDAIGSQAGRP
jgi:hypothetical protein